MLCLQSSPRLKTGFPDTIPADIVSFGMIFYHHFRDDLPSSGGWKT
ncbi:hypothetical protein GbCGDNIH2_7141 [Granulibacter bethesdensis]|uniref:Uncharacterized protein n=1 Tax=Granulibacter bethesdensis (strain ATCC BAA-1260 / CGDNIH1) TaxID=391165 RepID=A0A286M340_GRABC|nr:hypothetical protein GbCGDNIH2_7141 [Granulibacter bethesdensis]APH64971.1 hypothetical protein GbCGDNIH1I4_7141 [Granulibacter bethesdensis]ASV62439.1 hypothetical protein GbCGDNIH1_7141 [Granulibacter bethesdensis CGDNIH1]